MERLTLHDQKKRFEGVLAEQHLSDLSQFYREGFFDEIPLYSRSSQIAFLESMDRASADRVLLRLSLKYLDDLVNYGHPISKFLAAVTVFDFGKDERLVPNIFVCHGKVDEILKDRLILKAPKSVFGARVDQLVNEVEGTSELHVLQDTLSIPRKAKVFIAHTTHPDPRMVGIDYLKHRDKVRNGRASPFR